MRDRDEIEAEVEKVEKALMGGWEATNKLKLEVLLDIRDRLGEISVKASHLVEGIGLLRDIKKDLFK